jgi:hypothetical protein
LSVWNVFKDHLALSRTCSFPKASAKVRQFFEPANKYKYFFEKSGEKINHASKTCAILLKLQQKSQKPYFPLMFPEQCNPEKFSCHERIVALLLPG